ncbi:hypothetical protein [Ureibacillus thermophilus]|uniref:Uncharacterized protein n=1 Tax=Ureibacillus thermophilus TaxID=367743 RepID=A0A4P6UQM0_9BACL|nr:hypothetical protein [Ureibacillus thermophilus]QBK25274.1 hypothetical protein DKZ56_05000 [Ureibacillus thermophilus]
MKPFFYALLLGSILLVGCNNNDDDNAINDVDNGVEKGVEDVGEGIEEGVNDVGEGIDEALDNDVNNNDRQNPGLRNDVMPDDKGVNGDERGNQEDVIEDAKDIRDEDTKDE